MAQIRASKKAPKYVSAPSRPSFVLGSRPSDMYAPKVAPRESGNIMQPPRITPGGSTRNYGKTIGFGQTGLTGES